MNKLHKANLIFNL